MNNKTTFWLGILGALFFIVPSILGGFQFENYSHVSQFISESYATGTPYGIYLRVFGFIPSGLLIALFAFAALRHLPKSILLKLGLLSFGLFYGLGTIMVGVFPCDIGCNKAFINPSLSQIIHNFFGALTYMIVPFSLILIGISARKWKDGKTIAYTSFICAVIAFVGTALLTNDPTGEFIGLFQRVTEIAILFWLIRFAFYIKTMESK
jgi:hypothetical protein